LDWNLFCKGTILYLAIEPQGDKPSVKEKSRLMSLFIPIFLELLFTMLTGVVDTFMLASEGDKAVGAYAGMALDECGRAVFMFLRWHRGIWPYKNLVTEN
jgi:Na+-driven multidrug efflux pump